MSRSILLASRSPRRREILEWAGFDVKVSPADIDETWNPTTDPVEHALNLARAKAVAINSQVLLLAADTIVHVDGHLFDKPTHEAEAVEHLHRLSGRWHHVTTAVCLRHAQQFRCFSETTQVRFRSLGAQEIRQYVASGEPMDKAGAYGIQGLGGNLVAEVKGSWTNVKGLPLEACLRELTSLTRESQ